jgi:amino acid adenylation domain-containing protein
METVRDTLARLERLPVDKRRLLERLLAQQGHHPPAAPIPRRADGRAPLSSAQEQLWFLQQLDPASCAYNTRAAAQLLGPLSIAALRLALDSCIQRQEILRTVIREQEGRVMQIVLPHEPLDLPVIDLQALPTGDRETLAERMAARQAERPFVLAAAPARRVALYRLSAQEHWLVFVTHHILDDGWSSAVFLRELTHAYGAWAQGRTPTVTPLPIQYSDFALWQREWLESAQASAQLTFWRQALANLSTVDMPVDRPRLRPPSRGASQPVRLDPDVTMQALALARAEGVTPFVMFLTAFVALLHRCTGQSDVAVGAPFANRGRQELEGMVGLFANTLVLRTDLSGDPSFRTALRRARGACQSAYAHQDLPFERIVEALQPARDLTRHPLVQVVFVFQHAAAAAAAEAAGLTIRTRELPSTTTPFDLVLSLTHSGSDDRAEQVIGYLRYSTDLFDAATIAQLARHFGRVLRAAAAEPDRPLSQLPLLAAEEVRTLTASTRDLALPAPRLLHDRFEETAARMGDAPAVRCGSESTTYRALRRRVHQLASRLQQLGVEPDTCVALYLDRSLDLVVAILAVLEAGGAYVPIDPATPRNRVQFTLEDASAPIVLTQQALLDRLPPVCGRIICLDSDAAIIAAEPPDRPKAVVFPDNLAYVIYTSGSTGQPKGVGVSHANVSCLLDAAQRRFAFNEQDVWTLAHSYAFDFSVWEIWGALAYGGTLVIVPAWVSRSPADFSALLRHERVTVLNQTPSAFYQLMAETMRAPQPPPRLRYVMFGGERLEPAALAPWFSWAGAAGPRLINMYGITETTVHVTWHPVEAKDVAGRAPSPIGRPLDHLDLHVLDRHLQPAPLGITGELYVGGRGLARGYMHGPALTAERFVPNPWSRVAGDRLYKAGDLACRRRDGLLEFIGRNDRQVKIRGFRIELGEIERTLERCPSIVRAVVLAKEGRDGQLALTAFVQPDAEDPASAHDVRNWLKPRLPEYMVPATFVFIETIPLTTNGKLDTATLSRLDATTPSNDQIAAAPPATAVEIAIGAVWQEMLGRPHLDLDDNFFEVGGHSLLAAQLMTRIQEQLGVELSLRDFFAYPTIRELAGRAEAALLHNAS